MVDTKKIKMRLIEKDMSIGDLADMMRRSYANISSKINNKTPMTLEDAVKMQRILDIPDSQFCEFFLAGGRSS